MARWQIMEAEAELKRENRNDVFWSGSGNEKGKLKYWPWLSNQLLFPFRSEPSTADQGVMMGHRWSSSQWRVDPWTANLCGRVVSWNCTWHSKAKFWKVYRRIGLLFLENFAYNCYYKFHLAGMRPDCRLPVSLNLQNNRNRARFMKVQALKRKQTRKNCPCLLRK